MLNTKQVRAIAKAYPGPRPRAQTYTDKTKEDKANTRRSVVFCFWDGADADAFAGYMLRNIPNPVKRTGTTADFWKRNTGGEYVRVIAQIAE
jgi:hypothetical protein